MLRLAASDGDVSAWEGTKEEDSGTDSQHFLTQFPVRDLIFGGTRQLHPGCVAEASQRCVRNVGALSVLSHLHFGCAKAPHVPG